jgi:hypothetical protein
MPTCPYCGAIVPVPAGAAEITCHNCGTALSVDRGRNGTVLRASGVNPDEVQAAPGQPGTLASDSLPSATQVQSPPYGETKPPRHSRMLRLGKYSVPFALGIGVGIVVFCLLCFICSLLLPEVAEATPTALPQPTPTATSRPTATVAPTASLRPTADVAGCSLGATFQEDITIPDGASISAGNAFTKTWAVANTGTCEWGPAYYLAFLEGDAMQAPLELALPHAAAGETALISVSLVAPSDPGEYYGRWRICVNDGSCFGDVLYVQIAATAPPTPAPTPLAANETAFVDCVDCVRQPPFLAWLRSEPGTAAGAPLGALFHTDEVTILDSTWVEAEGRFWYQVRGHDEYTGLVGETVVGWLPADVVTAGVPASYPMGLAWIYATPALIDFGEVYINVWAQPDYYNAGIISSGKITIGAQVEILDMEWDPDYEVWYYEITGPDYATGETITAWLDGIFLVLAPLE